MYPVREDRDGIYKRSKDMIRLQQPKNYPHATSMAVEIEILPLEEPDYAYTRLRLRYLIDERKVLEMGSSIFLGRQQEPLTWLEKAVKTRRQVLSARFGCMLGEHLIYIQQTRIPQILIDDALANSGAKDYPYPFTFDIEILVNPDSEGLSSAGIGMHFTCLSYSQPDSR
jgi:hypothetical protein